MNKSTSTVGFDPSTEVYSLSGITLPEIKACSNLFNHKRDEFTPQPFDDRLSIRN